MFKQGDIVCFKDGNKFKGKLGYVTSVYKFGVIEFITVAIPKFKNSSVYVFASEKDLINLGCTITYPEELMQPLKWYGGRIEQK